MKTFIFSLLIFFKLLVFSFFLLINWNYEGSPGWAFQHLTFFYILLFIFLPLSFFEKSVLLSKSVNSILVYIPLFIVLSNLIPLFLGNWSTTAFIFTQSLGIVLVIFEIILFFKPKIGKISFP
jgi:hypothetical protein